MGIIGRALDRLPDWVQKLLFVFAIVWSVYYVTRFGFWSFLLHALFSPFF
jgi:hypothetical protein